MFFTVSDNISVKYHLASDVIIIVTSLLFTEGERLKRNSWKHFLIKPKDLTFHPTPGWPRHQQQGDCQKPFWGNPDHNIPLDAAPCAGVSWICAQLKVGRLTMTCNHFGMSGCTDFPALPAAKSPRPNVSPQTRPVSGEQGLWYTLVLTAGLLSGLPAHCSPCSTPSELRHSHSLAVPLSQDEP